MKMSRFVMLSFLLLGLTIYPLLSQTANSPTDSHVVIEGEVVDTLHQAVPYAYVSLFVGDRFETGAVGDDEGYFKIKVSNNPEMSYYLLVSSIGHQSQKIVLTDEVRQKKKLTIVLKENTLQLQEVVVQGIRNSIVTSLNGYTISTKELRKTRNNVFDLLSVLPGITIQDDQIKVQGKERLLVQIGKRLLRVSDHELTQILKGYDASFVDKVEVLQQPPSRYNRDGQTALIVLNMSEQYSDYIGGNISTEAQLSELKQSIHPYGMIIYNRGKISSFLNLAYTYEHRKAIMNSWYYRENHLEREDNSLQKNNIQLPFLYAGLQYDYHKNGNIGTTITFTDEQQRATAEETNFFGKDLNVNSDRKTSALRYDNSGKLRMSVNAYIDHKLSSNGMRIWGDVSYYTYGRKNTESVLSQHYAMPNTLSPIAQSNFEGKNNIVVSGWAAKVDYYAPLDAAKKWVVEAGSNILMNKTENDKQDKNNGLQQSYHYLYRERMLTSYLSLKATLSQQVSLTVGASIPFVARTGKLNDALQFDKKNSYFLPYFRISYLPAKQHALYVNYGEYQIYPSFFHLNPFKWKINEYTQQKGNPDLLPTKRYRGDLNYVYMSRIGLGVYYSYSKDIISQTYQFDPKEQLLTYQMMNTQNSKSGGVRASYYFNKFRWVQGAMEVFYGHATYNSILKDKLPQASSKELGFNVNTSFIFNKARTFLGETKFYYQMPRRETTHTTNAQYGLHIKLMLFLMQRQLSLTFVAQDLLRPPLKGEYFAHGTAIAYHNKVALPTFFLNVTYRFGKAKAKRNYKGNSNSHIEQRL